MNDTTRGRGACIYMTILTALALINAVGAFFFVDVDAVFQTAVARPGPIEIGAWISILLNLVFLFWNSILVKGVRRTALAFILTASTAFLAEGLGVHYGYIFGHYHYTDLLRLQVWAVPIIVCLAWEPILYAAYCLTDFLIPSEVSRTSPWLLRILSYLVLAVIGGMATTAWDLMIDPFAVNRGWWVWEEGGAYMQAIANGVPLSNFFGWWKVAFVCHLIYRIVLATGPEPHRSPYLTVYGPMMLYLNLLIGGFSTSLLILKRPDVCMIGLMCMGVLFLIGLAKIILLRRGIEPSRGEIQLRESSGIN